VSRWVTMHGFAFNVNTDLNLFNGIIPCGIQDKSVTSLSKEINRIINIQEVKEKLLTNFKEVFGYSNILSVQEEDLFQTKIVNT
jgi:lipoyl(octanoyl) transferase